MGNGKIGRGEGSREVRREGRGQVGRRDRRIWG